MKSFFLNKINFKNGISNRIDNINNKANFYIK